MHTIIFIYVTGDEPDDMELDTPKIYEPIVDLDSLKERLQSFLQQYNEATRGGDVDLVFFKVCDDICM